MPLRTATRLLACSAAAICLCHGLMVFVLFVLMLARRGPVTCACLSPASARRARVGYIRAVLALGRITLPSAFCPHHPTRQVAFSLFNRALLPFAFSLPALYCTDGVLLPIASLVVATHPLLIAPVSLFLMSPTITYLLPPYLRSSACYHVPQDRRQVPYPPQVATLWRLRAWFCDRSSSSPIDCDQTLWSLRCVSVSLPPGLQLTSLAAARRHSIRALGCSVPSLLRSHCAQGSTLAIPATLLWKALYLSTQL